MEAIQIIKFYSLDLMLLLVPVLFIVISTIKGLSTRRVVAYGLVLSIITSIIVQSRYPGHAHVPGSEVFFAVLVMLVCCSTMIIALVVRKLASKDTNT